MIIHNSHTKEQLIKIIKLLDLEIKYSNLVKIDLIKNIKDYFEDISSCDKLNKNPFGFKIVNDLFKFLEESAETDKTKLCLKDKEKLILTARKIIAFVNNGCDYDLSIFRNQNDLHASVIFVAKYGGSIATCRRSVNLINNTLPPDKKYEMDIDIETQNELNQRQLKKFLATPKFHKKQKKVLITFD